MYISWGYGALESLPGSTYWFLVWKYGSLLVIRIQHNIWKMICWLKSNNRCHIFENFRIALAMADKDAIKDNSSHHRCHIPVNLYNVSQHRPKYNQRIRLDPKYWCFEMITVLWSRLAEKFFYSKFFSIRVGRGCRNGAKCVFLHEGLPYGSQSYSDSFKRLGARQGLWDEERIVKGSSEECGVELKRSFEAGRGGKEEEGVRRQRLKVENRDAKLFRTTKVKPITAKGNQMSEEIIILYKKE